MTTSTHTNFFEELKKDNQPQQNLQPGDQFLPQNLPHIDIAEIQNAVNRIHQRIEGPMGNMLREVLQNQQNHRPPIQGLEHIPELERYDFLEAARLIIRGNRQDVLERILGRFPEEPQISFLSKLGNSFKSLFSAFLAITVPLSLAYQGYCYIADRGPLSSEKPADNLLSASSVILFGGALTAVGNYLWQKKIAEERTVETRPSIAMQHGR